MIAEVLARGGHHVRVLTSFPQDPDGKTPKRYRGKILCKEAYSRQIEILRVWVPPLPHKGFVRRLLVYSSFMSFSLIGLLFSGGFHVGLGTDYPPFVIVPSLIYKKARRMRYLQFLGDLWPDVLFDLGIVKSKAVRELAEYVCKVSYNMVDEIVVITQAIKEGIVGRGINEDKVFVIPLAVDTELFKPQEKNWSLLPEVKGKFVVMYSGIFGPAYDFDSLLSAGKLLEHYENIAIVIRGDGERRDEIVDKISRLNLRNVTIPGVVSDTREVVKYLNVADAFVVPMTPVNVSVTAHPSKIFEFLACGKPVVCCSDGELARLTEESGAGIVTKPGDPESLAKAILELYENVNKRTKMGENGRKFVIENHSYNAVTQKISKLVESVQDA